MKLFKPQEDESYLVRIKNSLRFNLAIRHISVGLSFRQTSKVIEQHHLATKNAISTASTTTWSVSSFTFSLLFPYKSSPMFSRIQQFGRFHLLLMQALIWVFLSSINGFACA
ncbi:unnamed protein product [Sphagnum jensenii]|uniref:Uncharacterized protein n=1 Tax=Sphagnum jensenii TaxID=128206 RepID=A0ABP1AU95_9BRYO